MAQNKQKIVQAFIRAVADVAREVIKADNLAQSYKTKWQNLNPDLTGTNLTQAQINAVNAWITALNDLRNSPIVTAALNKDIVSHGAEALD